MSPKVVFPVPSFVTAPRVAVIALLFTTAVFTGCNNSPESAAADNFPSLLGASHTSGEPVDTLGANFALPPDTHHRTRLHDEPAEDDSHSSHRSL